MKGRTFSKKEQIVLTLIAAALAFAVSVAAVRYLDIDSWMLNSYGLVLISIVVSFILLTFVLFNKKILIGIGILIAVVSGIFLIMWLRGNIGEEFTESISAFFSWLNKFIFSWKANMDIPTAYGNIVTSAMTFLISLFMYSFIVKKFFFPVVFVVSMTIFILQWAVAREVSKVEFYIAVTALIFLYFTGVYVRRTGKLEKQGEKHRYLDMASFMTAAVPVVAAIIVLVLVIPKSPEPIKWKWLDDIIKYRDVGADKPVDFKSYDSFSLAATGFSSEAGRLGGSVTLDMSHMLDVYSSEPLYLRGESWPYFNGSKWGNGSGDVNYAELLVDYPDYNSQRQMLLEAAYGWRFINLNRWLVEDFPTALGITVLPGVDFNSVLGSHLLPDWYDIKRAEVNYAGVETKTMFAPLYAELNNYNDLKPVYVETDGTLDSGKDIRLFTVLDYDYLSLDRSNPYFLEAVRQSKRGIYQDLLSRLYYITYNADSYSNIRVTNSMDSTLEDLYELSQKADIIYWRYTNLPDDLPQRVADLASEVTAGYDNDFDKVTALEDYLSSEYAYSLTVEDVPEGRDFVDWFLFDSKEGYCTYYATAMTIMVRTLGLPARYVEGFVTPSSPVEADRYAVLNSNAHAWVEVYFEGIGWIPFEPTSPYNLILNSVETGNPEQGENLLDDPAFNPNIDEPDKDDASPLIDIEGDGNYAEGNGLGGFWIAMIVIGGWLFVSFAVYISRILFFLNIRTRRQFKVGYNELLRLLSLKGIKRSKGMTLKELAQQIDETFYMGKVSMKDLTNTYYKILYSENEIDPVEYRLMSTFFRDFRKELDSELRMWELLAFRILLPLI